MHCRQQASRDSTCQSRHLKDPSKQRGANSSIESTPKRREDFDQNQIPRDRHKQVSSTGRERGAPFVRALVPATATVWCMLHARPKIQQRHVLPYAALSLLQQPTNELPHFCTFLHCLHVLAWHVSSLLGSRNVGR